MSRLSEAFMRLRCAVTAGGYVFDRYESRGVEVDARGLLHSVDATAAYLSEGPAVGSEIPWVVEEMAVYSLGDLVEAQDGYRWLGSDQSQRLARWRSEWVVIASVFGDPYFIDNTKDGLPVYYPAHGMGGWTPVRVAPSLWRFFEALATFERVLLGEFVLDVWDDEGLRPQFILRLSDALAETLDSSDLANFMRAINE